jgi:hypothetical protein
VHEVNSISITGKLLIQLAKLRRLHEPGAAFLLKSPAAPPDHPLVTGKEQLVPKSRNFKETLPILLKAPSALLWHKDMKLVLPVQDFFLAAAEIKCHLFYE